MKVTSVAPSVQLGLALAGKQAH